MVIVFSLIIIGLCFTNELILSLLTGSLCVSLEYVASSVNLSNVVLIFHEN